MYYRETDPLPGISMAKIITLGLERELRDGSAKSVDITRRVLRTYTHRPTPKEQ